MRTDIISCTGQICENSFDVPGGLIGSNLCFTSRSEPSEIEKLMSVNRLLSNSENSTSFSHTLPSGQIWFTPVYS